MGTSAPGASVPAGGGLGLQGEGPPGPPRVKRQLRVEMGGDRAREGGQRVGREQGGGLTSGQTPAGGHSGHSQSTREPAGRSHHLSVCSASACHPPGPVPRAQGGPAMVCLTAHSSSGARARVLPSAEGALHTTRVHTRSCVHAQVHAHTRTWHTHPCVCSQFTRLQCTPAHVYVHM